MQSKTFCAAYAFTACAACLLLLQGCVTTTTDEPDGQMRFPNPESAARVLAGATQARDHETLAAIFGPRMDELAADDPAQRNVELQRFAAAMAREHSWSEKEDGSQVLQLSGWEFPAPLVKGSEGWYFDTAAGVDTVLTRRIGRNELDAIRVSKVYLRAQQEFAARDLDGNGKPDHATKLVSSAGKHDGLYWPDEEGQPQSPLGPFADEAAGEAADTKPGERKAYRGYHYQLIPDGAPDNVVLIAYPAQYGESGIASFKTSLDGKIMEKDIGDPSKLDIASLELVKGWKPVGSQE